jgi:hypothetical protein
MNPATPSLVRDQTAPRIAADAKTHEPRPPGRRYIERRLIALTLSLSKSNVRRRLTRAPPDQSADAGRSAGRVVEIVIWNNCLNAVPTAAFVPKDLERVNVASPDGP